MRQKKVRRTILTTVLACSLAAMPVYAVTEEEYREEQKQQEQIQSELEGQKAQVQTEVDSLTLELSNLMIQMNDLQYQLIEKGQEIAQAEEDLAQAKEDEKQQYEAMKLRIVYMYEAGENSALEKIASSGSMAEVLSQAEYIQNVHEADREMLQEYADTVQAVEDLKTQLEAEMQELEALQDEYEAQSVLLNETITSKSSEVQNLEAQIQEAAKLAAEASANADAVAAEEAARLAAQQALQNQQQNQENQQNNTDNGGSADNGEDTTTTGGSNQTFVPDYNQSASDIIVSAAWSQVGVAMYGWGMQVPYSAFDCSGLTQWCYAQAGISIPRTDITQLNAGTIVSNPMPGDICWTPGHVAIYIGNGQMIEAQQSGVPICVSPVRATYYVRF